MPAKQTTELREELARTTRALNVDTTRLNAKFTDTCVSALLSVIGHSLFVLLTAQSGVSAGTRVRYT